MRLQMYRPPALDSSILKSFCRLRFKKRGRHGGTTLHGAQQKPFSPHVAILFYPTSPKECAGFWAYAHAWATTPPRISIYTAAIFFIFFNNINLC